MGTNFNLNFNLCRRMSLLRKQMFPQKEPSKRTLFNSRDGNKFELRVSNLDSIEYKSVSDTYSHRQYSGSTIFFNGCFQCNYRLFI